MQAYGSLASANSEQRILLMANQMYQNQKKPMAFSKKQVSKAGRKLRKGAIGAEEIEAIQKIQDFRASHSYPLMLIKNHLWRTAKRVDKNVMIARRLKRLPTILDKLKRPTLDGKTANSLDVVRMQDIGGCRAIFKNQKDVYRLLKKLKASNTVHSIVRCDDYIANPKATGYRGIHLVYSCYENANDDSDADWKGHKIEVQIRSQSQHAWSTAIELVDLYEGTKLKTSTEGDDKWRNFFYALSETMSALERAMELAEDQRTVENIFGPNGPERDAKVVRYADSLIKVKEIGAELGVLEKLLSYTMALDSVVDGGKKNGVYVLAIYERGDSFKGNIRWFKDSQREKAIELYDQHELDSQVYQTVLVGAQGAGTLAQAYPNFFADTSRIINIISVLMNEDVPVLRRASVVY